MWKNLSFRERAELLSQWRKEHVIDYRAKKKEYDASIANKHEDGGGKNSMNYEHRGTVYSDDLVKQGITHTAELPNITITGRNPKNYRSSYDPLALYKYGIAPALEGVGKLFDLALKPVDYAFDAVTSPAWWLNKAITGNSDNTIQDIRDWTHQAVRDAGMVLSPTRDIGTLRTGFNYAPWNPENPGVFGNDEVGNALNNTMDLITAPVMPKAIAGTPRTLVAGLEEIGHTNRARAAVYNNVTPWNYHNTALGTYKINHLKEVAGAVKDFVTPGKIDVSHPKWLDRYVKHIKEHPEEKRRYYGTAPQDNISMPALMGFRDQAWAKALKQPDNPKWPVKIYKDNGDGTVSYDLNAVNWVRNRVGGDSFSGEPFYDSNIGGYLDNITSNGGVVGIEYYPEYYRMTDTWDLQPFATPINKFLQGRGKNLPQAIKDKLKDVAEYDFIEQFFGGDPFKLDMTWVNSPDFDLFDYNPVSSNVANTAIPINGLNPLAAGAISFK